MSTNKEKMMEIFMELFHQENYLAKREGMKMLHELLLKGGDFKYFQEYFVGEKEHLKLTMQSLNDDSTGIQIEAFYLLLLFLKAPLDVRGPRVNDTLRKNKEPLLLFVTEFQPNPGKVDESLETKKEQAQEIIEDLD